MLFRSCRTEADLPQNARDYLAFIADAVGVPIKLLGVGPAKDQVVWFGDMPAALAALA